MRFLLLTMLLAACAPADHDLTPEAGPQAGSVALKSEALVPACNSLHEFARRWLDQQTLGTLQCGNPSSDSTWYCMTQSPPITYKVSTVAEVYQGNYCDTILRHVTPSQSSSWRFKCSQVGVSASCKKQ